MYTKRTYRLSWAIVGALNTISNENKIHLSELVRFLLIRAIEDYESGTIEIPTLPSSDYVVNWEETGVNIGRWHG